MLHRKKPEKIQLHKTDLSKVIGMIVQERCVVPESTLDFKMVMSYTNTLNKVVASNSQEADTERKS